MQPSQMTRISEWNDAQGLHAPEDQILWTMISDERGVRNVQLLRRKGRLWFVPDMSMYVYYAPTHWKEAHQDTESSGQK